MIPGMDVCEAGMTEDVNEVTGSTVVRPNWLVQSWTVTVEPGRVTVRPGMVMREVTVETLLQSE